MSLWKAVLCKLFAFGDLLTTEMRGMSAAEIIAQLQAAVRKLEEAQRQVAAAGQSASEARQLVAGALEGSSGQLVGQVEKLIQALSQVGQMPAATKEQVQAAVRRTQALGN